MIRGWVESVIDNVEYSRNDGLNYWRERIFKSILLSIVFFGIFPYAFGLYMSIKNEVYLIAILDTLLYSVAVFTLIYRRLMLKTSIYIIIGMAYVVGISLVLFIGPASSGMDYLIGASILASLLLGLRGSIYSLTISTVLIIAITIGLFLNVFGDLLISF